MKVMMAGLAAFVAGIGGGLLAITLGVALPNNYTTLGGEVWLVVLVTNGIRSNAAAVFAGLAQTLLGGLALVYLPKVFGNFVPIAFGLGAIAIVQFPQGLLTAGARSVRSTLVDIRWVRPKLYGRLKVVGAVYLVVLIVLVVWVRDLWWLWLAITAFLGSVTIGFLTLSVGRQPDVAPVAVEAPEVGLLQPVDVR
jgi:hypothetical protein